MRNLLIDFPLSRRHTFKLTRIPFLSVKTRTKAVYKGGVLKPLMKLDLEEGEEVDIEIKSAVKRTYGMFKVDRETAKEIAESEDLSYLDA